MSAFSTRPFLALACCLLAACSSGTTGSRLQANTLHSVEALREDLAYLRETHALRHPRRYQSPPDDALEQAFATARSSLDRPMTRAEAFRHIAVVNPGFRDAHALLMPLVGEVDADDPTQARFPLAVRLDGQGQLRVRGDWQRSGDARLIPDGTALTHINGVPVTALLDKLARYSHGETAILQRHILGLMFPHWLHAVEGWQGDFSVGWLEHGEAVELTLFGSDTWTGSGLNANDLPSLSFPSPRTALLRLPTFDVDEASDAYTQQIDAAFHEILRKRPDALVIDVRGNTGGQSDAGVQVIRRLIDHPVNQGSRARERLNEDNNGLFGYRGEPGSLVEMDVSRDGRIEPAPADERFQGRVVLLVDVMTYSAAILFATTIQDNGLATLIGQPTGGFANQTGNMAPITLPNTGLLAYMPSREFVRPNGDRREGPVMPDIVVGDAQGGPGDDDPALRCAVAFLEQTETGGVAPTLPEACLRDDA